MDKAKGQIKEGGEGERKEWKERRREWERKETIGSGDGKSKHSVDFKYATPTA